MTSKQQSDRVRTRGAGVIAAFALLSGLVYSSVSPWLQSEQASAAGTIVVSPANMDQWTVQESGTASGSFVTGPGSPPLGAGSFRMAVGSNGNSAVQLRNRAYSGVLLSSITRLEYSTYVQTAGGQAPYIILNIDTDGNGTTDDQLFFEPVYQNGTYGTVTGATVPNQCATPACVSMNAWQNWNARTGGWWTLNANTGGPPLTTLDRYVQTHSGARISTTAAGGIRIVTGFGAPPWNNFLGATDAFIIGVQGSDTTYNFEPFSASSSSSFSSSSTSSSLSSSSSSIACTPVSTSGLLGHWKLDEGTGSVANDSAGTNQQGILQNGPAWTAGTPSISPNPAALSFDGTDDLVRVSNTGGTFNLGTSDFTVSTWIRTNAGNRGVLGDYSSASRGWGLYLYSTNRVNFFGYGTAGANDTSHPATVLDNAWHHLAGVYSRTGSSLTIRTYIDGGLVGTNTANVGDISSNSDLLFGDYLLQPNYAGSLDDIRVYTRALTGQEVAALAAHCAGSSSSSSSSSLSSSSSVSSSFSSSSSSAGGIPSCHGMTATIYVQNNKMVGGPQNGQTYNGQILGSSGNDVIVGTANGENIQGGNGDDVICGRGGSDRIAGENGSDRLHGGQGNDYLSGGNGADQLFGGPGNDYLAGGQGADVLCGRGNNDLLSGQNGPDRLDGGQGTDFLGGGNGNDACADGPFTSSCEQSPNNIAECSVGAAPDEQ